MLILFIKALCMPYLTAFPALSLRDRKLFCIFLALQLFLQTTIIYKKKYDKCNLLSCQLALI